MADQSHTGEFTEANFRHWFENWIIFQPRHIQESLRDIAEWDGDHLWRWTKREAVLRLLSKSLQDNLKVDEPAGEVF